MYWKTLLATIALAIPAMAIAQQVDIIVRPTSAIAPWRAQAASIGVVPSLICLITCETATNNAYLTFNPTTHNPCIAVDALSVIVAGSITVPFGEGDNCYRAVAVSATNVVSEPSLNAEIVQDIPLPPEILPPN